MDDQTTQVLNSYAELGGEIIGYSRWSQGLQLSKQYLLDEEEKLIDYLQEKEARICFDKNPAYGVALHDAGTAHVLHIVNYNYNKETHKIDPILQIRMKFNLKWKILTSAHFRRTQKYV